MAEREPLREMPYHEILAKRLAEGEEFQKSVVDRANNALMFGEGETSASSFLRSLKGNATADALFEKLEVIKEGKKRD